MDNQITYIDEYGDETPAYWLACGIGKRDHMIMIELGGELGWCSNDRIDTDMLPDQYFN